MGSVPKLVASRDVIRHQREKKLLKTGTLVRCLIQSVKRSIWDKEEREPEKRGTCAITLGMAPLQDPENPKTLIRAYRISSNVILPIQHPDYPEHQPPNTAFQCVRWGQALFPEALPPKLVWNKLRSNWTLSEWDSDAGLYVPKAGPDGKPELVLKSDDPRVDEMNIEFDAEAVEAWTRYWADDALLKGLIGLAVYGTVQVDRGFQNLENPSISIPQGRQYGPVPDPREALSKSDEDEEEK